MKKVALFLSMFAVFFSVFAYALPSKAFAMQGYYNTCIEFTNQTYNNVNWSGYTPAYSGVANAPCYCPNGKFISVAMTGVSCNSGSAVPVTLTPYFSSISFSPSSIEVGQSSTLTWNAMNADGIEIYCDGPATLAKNAWQQYGITNTNASKTITALTQNGYAGILTCHARAYKVNTYQYQYTYSKVFDFTWNVKAPFINDPVMTTCAEGYYWDGRQCRLINTQQFPVCKEPVPGISYITNNITCACPDGRIQGSNGGYATCYTYQPTPVYENCWDGSMVRRDLRQSCPGYIYCSDGYIKRPLSYVCPINNTQTCSDGSVIRIWDICPTSMPYCYWVVCLDSSSVSPSIYPTTPYYDAIQSSYSTYTYPTYGYSSYGFSGDN